jgi:glyoxylase I family protein
MTDAGAIAGVSHLSLSVRDLDRSLTFYRDVMGLDVFVEPFDGEVFKGRQAMVLAGRIAISLQAHDANDGSAFSPTRAGLDHLAFHLRSLDDLRAWDQRLTELRVAHSEIKPAGQFGSMIELVDPDGIQLELFAAG